MGEVREGVVAMGANLDRGDVRRNYSTRQVHRKDRMLTCGELLIVP